MKPERIYHDVIQGEPEWHLLRAGKFTASKAAVIMGGLDTSGLASYIKDLAWERVFGPIDGGFKSDAMAGGILQEPESRDWFGFVRGVTVEQIGMVQRLDYLNCGWSPDGLFQERQRGLEAKNPLHKAWMEVKRTGKVPAEYRWQCKFGQWVGGLEEMEFISYHRVASGLIVPISATPEELAQIEERINLLEPKVQAWVDILQDKKGA